MRLAIAGYERDAEVHAAVRDELQDAADRHDREWAELAYRSQRLRERLVEDGHDPENGQTGVSVSPGGQLHDGCVACADPGRRIGPCGVHFSAGMAFHHPCPKFGAPS